MTSPVYLDWLSRGLVSRSLAGPVASKAEDAVLGCAAGCDLSEIAPFVRSLRAVFAGQIILLVDRKPTLLAWLSTHGVETISAADRRPHLKPHPTVARLAVYAQLLQERAEIRNVILADVRDAVFQADPFRDAPADLHLFTGAASNSGLNVQTMQALVGEASAANLAKRSSVSSSLIAGPVEAVVRFCRAMLLMCDIPRSTIGGGIEQAAHHVIAHLGLVGGDLRPNFERVAITWRGMRAADGRIRNPDDSTSPIVVGYRSHPDLAAHVDQRWGLPPARRRVAETTLRRTMRTLHASLLGGSAELR